jgi:tetratricopeptide (TPR) repeat protein
MKKNKKHFGIFFLVFVLAGCVETIRLADKGEDLAAKTLAPAADQCLIYLHRIEQFLGGGAAVGILADDQPIGQMETGSYFLLKAPSGNHTLSMSPIPMTQIPRLTIACEGGRVYFVRLSMDFARFNMELLDEAQGREMIQTSRLVRAVSLTGPAKPPAPSPEGPPKPQISITESLKKAREARGRGDFEAAIRFIKSAMQTDPKDPGPYREAAEVFLTLCDREGAARAAEAGGRFHFQDQSQMKITPLPAGATLQSACQAQELNRLGVALAREGKAAEALARFEEALRAAPGFSAKAHYNAGLILEEQGRWKEALRHYMQAQRLFIFPEEETEVLKRISGLARAAKIPVPETADRAYRLGIVRTNQKRYGEAVEEFEAALAEAPWLAEAYYNLGLVYDFNREYGKALLALRLYTALSPTAPNLGTVKTKIVELEDRLGLIEKRKR